jgi:PKD repeat protein
VRMFKLIRRDASVAPPAVAVTAPSTGNAGDTLRFIARPSSENAPVLQYAWDFGDGTSASSAEVDHAFTHAGTYQVRIHAVGLDGSSSDQSHPVVIHGAVTTKYLPGAKRRLTITP